MMMQPTMRTGVKRGVRVSSIARPSANFRFASIQEYCDIR
ncbi:hypothetical protein thalar_03407 [Litoreibacter arenae DSM 19593]|uniref:Uncharacterized protein n=1 Tax=Litoreibacter arenae DSM 19593 TaxID=1123360 RepID=S9QCM2_9RHOB|nr:hypothetical protein thalar_03407 [Litoreibacter arenae DSM 19593]